VLILNERLKVTVLSGPKLKYFEEIFYRFHKYSQDEEFK